MAAHGWLYSPDDKGYHRELAVFPEDLIGYLKETQPAEWAKLKDWHNGGTEKAMAEQVMASERVKQDFAKIVLDVVYDGLRQRATSNPN